MRKIIIGLCILMILLVSCTSSFNDCYSRCMRIEKQNRGEKYWNVDGCLFGQYICFSTPKIEIEEICFENCKCAD